MKFCSDCMFYEKRTAANTDLCHHDESAYTQPLNQIRRIAHRIEFASCMIMRLKGGKCSDGKLYAAVKLL